MAEAFKFSIIDERLSMKQLAGYNILILDTIDLDKLNEQLEESDIREFSSKNIILVKMNSNAEELGDGYRELTIEDKHGLFINAADTVFMRFQLH